MTGFHHEALLYADQDAFLAGTVPFLEEGLFGGERMLVALGADRIAALMAALERRADCVRFADMAHVGANPARIIPVWRDFVAGREDDAPVRATPVRCRRRRRRPSATASTRTRCRVCARSSRPTRPWRG